MKYKTILDWNFTPIEPISFEKNISDSFIFKQSLLNIAKILRVLLDYELLQVETVIVNNEISNRIDIKNNDYLIGLLVGLCNTTTCISFFGKSGVLRNNKLGFESDILRFDYYIDTTSFKIRIFNDLWLPFNLKDEWQTELCDANMPRLQKCLFDIFSLFENYEYEVDYGNSPFVESDFRLSYPNHYIDYQIKNNPLETSFDVNKYRIK